MHESTLPTQQSTQTLGQCVDNLTHHLLTSLHGSPPDGLYQMVVGIVESALIHAVLKHANGNQSAAAKTLGISRTTLRNKLNTAS